MSPTTVPTITTSMGEGFQGGGSPSSGSCLLPSLSKTLGVIAPRGAVQPRYERVILREILREMLTGKFSALVLPGTIAGSRLNLRALRGRRPLPKVFSLVNTTLAEEFDPEWIVGQAEGEIRSGTHERQTRYEQMARMVGTLLVFLPEMPPNLSVGELRPRLFRVQRA